MHFHDLDVEFLVKGAGNALHQSGKQIHCLEGHSREVYAVAFMASGHRLASAGNDGIIRLWHPETGKERERTAAALRAGLD